MSDATILVVDDDRTIRDLLNDALDKSGFGVIVATNAAEGLEIAAQHRPDLIILDIRMPGMDGLQMLQEIRAARATAGIPVIILTAEKTETQVITGLELGADDFVSKPFGVGSLIARVRSVLRRSRNAAIPAAELAHGPFTLRTEKRAFTYAGQAVAFTATEFRMVELLFGNAGKVFSRGELSTLVRDVDADPNDRTIDAHIKSIRKKLGAGAEAVQTVRGFGYKFQL